MESRMEDSATVLDGHTTQSVCLMRLVLAKNRHESGGIKICGLNWRSYYSELFLFLNVNMWTFKVKWTDLHDIRERYRDLIILPVSTWMSLKNTANNMLLSSSERFCNCEAWKEESIERYSNPSCVTWLRSFRNSGPWRPGYDRLTGQSAPHCRHFHLDRTRPDCVCGQGREREQVHFWQVWFKKSLQAIKHWLNQDHMTKNG